MRAASWRWLKPLRCLRLRMATATCRCGARGGAAGMATGGAATISGSSGSSETLQRRQLLLLVRNWTSWQRSQRTTSRESTGASVVAIPSCADEAARAWLLPSCRNASPRPCAGANRFAVGPIGADRASLRNDEEPKLILAEDRSHNVRQVGFSVNYYFGRYGIKLRKREHIIHAEREKSS